MMMYDERPPLTDVELRYALETLSQICKGLQEMISTVDEKTNILRSEIDAMHKYQVESSKNFIQLMEMITDLVMKP